MAEMDQSLAPCGGTFVRARITRLSYMPQASKTHGEFSDMLEDYVEDLEHLPADILDEACKKARKESDFFPGQKRLLDLSAKEYHRRKSVRRRFQILRNVADNPTDEITRDWWLTVSRY